MEKPDSSNTDFILEAIDEKLKRDEEKVKDLFKNMVKSAFYSHETSNK